MSFSGMAALVEIYLCFTYAYCMTSDTTTKVTTVSVQLLFSSQRPLQTGATSVPRKICFRKSPLLPEVRPPARLWGKDGFCHFKAEPAEL